MQRPGDLLANASACRQHVGSPCSAVLLQRSTRASKLSRCNQIVDVAIAESALCRIDVGLRLPSVSRISLRKPNLQDPPSMVVAKPWACGEDRKPALYGMRWRPS